MAGSFTLVLEEEAEDWSLPLWRETLLGVDWLKLHASKVFYGLGVPRGDGAAVVLVPGFLGHDIYLAELYGWLWRMGYTPYMSRIGHHADCPNILIGHLLKTVRRAHKKTGRPVHLVGHSLGGVLSLGAAAMAPGLVGKVITLGSPIRGPKVHPWVLRQANLVRQRIYRNKHQRPKDKPFMRDCFTYHCACGFSCKTREEIPDGLPNLALLQDRRRRELGDVHHRLPRAEPGSQRHALRPCLERRSLQAHRQDARAGEEKAQEEVASSPGSGRSQEGACFTAVGGSQRLA
ncbi:MAG: alpha/beta fold hydrolase, partial [Candidatus Competibacteraceae bacterium]|nr:alpha/beta fold hydrolase [Candidatus Competibacteraceae bacterium]